MAGGGREGLDNVLYSTLMVYYSSCTDLRFCLRVLASRVRHASARPAAVAVARAPGRVLFGLANEHGPYKHDQTVRAARRDAERPLCADHAKHGQPKALLAVQRLNMLQEVDAAREVWVSQFNSGVN